MAYTVYAAAVEVSAAAAGEAGCECDCACICNRAGNAGKSVHALSVHSPLPAVCHLRARRRGGGRLLRQLLLVIVIAHPNARRSSGPLPEVAVPVLPCECKAPGPHMCLGAPQTHTHLCMAPALMSVPSPWVWCRPARRQRNIPTRSAPFAKASSLRLVLVSAGAGLLVDQAFPPKAQSI